ncbi:MAG: acylphosphatase [Gemmatimonadetes bacterium]|nr:acylphosphatase [Gemmatimonadota bacterium]
MRRAYRVVGKVQGVGFRWFTRETASSLGLRGTVRNASDGSVEVVVEGPEAAVAELRGRLAEGPPGADVARLEERSETPEGPLPHPFTIVR